MQANNPFRMDRARARVFAVLRMRVERVPRALEYCRGVFGRIFADFYPLDLVPSSLEKLCRMFSQPADLRRVVNHQIYVWARCAFAFVHTHWPGWTLCWQLEVLLVVELSQWTTNMPWQISLQMKL